MAVHLLFLAGVVVFAHHPAVFLGLFLFFLGFTDAYKRYQDRLILREGLMVAFFLAGLVTLGGYQKWWLEALLLQLNPTALYYGATMLTAVTDNAALTYLGSLVEGVSDQFKYALVAGAVTGGGLTVIANAPNPAGFSILKGNFRDESISPLRLLLAALGPTLVAVLAFQIGAP
jgi:predicted cation transporter